jgi:DNA-binding transcriptional ArsR family regulator
VIVEQDEETVVARIAAAIGEPARTRILYSLLDGHARTSTELAIVAEVSPSTASVHLGRLATEGLIKVLAQGRHRYYSLAGRKVARALEALSGLAGRTRKQFVPNTPTELRFARTCYDHMAGTVSVVLLNRFKELKWLTENSADGAIAYYLVPDGTKAFESLGIDLESTRALRRRFAYACLDWSERQPHLGGAFAAAFLQTALKRKWVERDLNSRALNLTSYGKREMLSLFGLSL